LSSDGRLGDTDSATILIDWNSARFKDKPPH